jgi:hypothetical protein
MIKNAAKSLIKNPDSKVGTNYMASALLHFHCFQRIWKPQVFIGLEILVFEWDTGYWMLDTGC